jgi:ABC-type nitrate/sulfonate/bicarbonate transport system substrate-binding protein
MSDIAETLKQKIDELDLDRRFNELAESAEQAVVRALDTAADYAREHRDDVERLLTRASTAIDERTDGKYADKVTMVREQLDRGVEKLTERRTDS